MGLETHSSDGLAPGWVAEILQPHLQEKHWRVLWQNVVCRGAFYYSAVLLGCRQTHGGTQEWMLYTVECAILISGKFPNSLTSSSGCFEYGTCMVHYCDQSSCTLFYYILFYSTSISRHQQRLDKKTSLAKIL